MSDAIVHLAGPQVSFENTVRQRCCWCGALIAEYDLTRMAVQIDETASPEVQQAEIEAAPGRWEGFVAVEGTNPVVHTAVDAPEDGKAPERSCMRSPL